MDARVNKHSYPVMSEAEVAAQLLTMFPDRLTGVEMNFRSPEFVQMAMSLFIEQLLGISVEEQNMLPLSVLSKYTRHSEMHSHARYHFLVLVQRLASKACLSVSISHADLNNPTTRRWLNVFSGLINYFKHAMNMRAKLTEIRRGRQALLEERSRLERNCSELKHQVTEVDCRQVERELQTKAMLREIRDKTVSNKQLGEKLEALSVAVNEQRRRLQEELSSRDEVLRLLKGAEDRLALVRYELVETPIDQIESEGAQLEASVQRQKELLRQRQSRFSELQRQQTNLQRSELALKEILGLTDRLESRRKTVLTAEAEISKLVREAAEKEKEILKRRSYNSRKELSEGQDTLFKLKLMQEHNDKQHEALRRKMESDLVVMEADLKTMEARVQTLSEQHADILRRQGVMEQQRTHRLQQLDWTIRQGGDGLRDFQNRAKSTMGRLLR